MSNIKDQIITLVKQRHHSHKVALEQEKDPRSKHAIDLIARIREDSQLIDLIDSLPEETCKDSLQVSESCKENQDSFTNDLEEAAEKYADKHGFRVPYDGSDNYYDDVDVKASKEGFLAGAEWAFRQGWTFDAHKGAFGICFDGNIDNLLDSLKDKEEVTVQIRKI